MTPGFVPGLVDVLEETSGSVPSCGVSSASSSCHGAGDLAYLRRGESPPVWLADADIAASAGGGLGDGLGDGTGAGSGSGGGVTLLLFDLLRMASGSSTNSRAGPLARVCLVVDPLLAAGAVLPLLFEALSVVLAACTRFGALAAPLLLFGGILKLWK